jgi:perosamine synthetase
MAQLARKGIGTRPFFWPMHRQPVYGGMGLFGREHHPNSEYMAEHGFYIPSGLALTEQQMQQVAAAVREVLG